MKPQRWISICPRHGVILHVDVDEKEARRYQRHHEKSIGDRPMLVGWSLGELEVIDQGALDGESAKVEVLAAIDEGAAGLCS
jgi:hypothetical protein